MATSTREPTYVHTEAEVIARSPTAAAFLQKRENLNQVVDAAENRLVKRFYNIDHNTYLDGALPALTKELMGLSVSLALRCDDCIYYHVIQAFRLGASRSMQEESINIALVIGGSIVIPHLRRAYALCAELYGPENAPGVA
jgi:AhpD family alkylhydroperoxidase